ncbi:hypothetical protein ACHAXA_011526 [Cyclostephanos tholiformis]|uniref:MORN repeat-containing protein n=1 Tax=Cyclostephanos tholiformis TaxID=382380 RepID=A0ABD3RRB6_9STRA
MGWQREPSVLPSPSLFQKNHGDNVVVKEEDWRNSRPINNGIRRASMAETPTPLSSLIPAASKEYNETPRRKSVELRTLRSSSLFQHTPNTWFGGKNNVAKEEDWRNTRPSDRPSSNNFKRTPTADSFGIFPIKRLPFVEMGRRSVSRGRSRNVDPDAKNANNSAERSESLSKKRRSKSRQSRQNNPTPKSRDTGTSESGKSSCTGKTSKPTRGSVSSTSNHDKSDRSGLTRSELRSAIGRNRSNNRDKDGFQSIKSRSVSRGSRFESSQMSFRHETHDTSDRIGLTRSSKRIVTGRSRSSIREKDISRTIKSRSVSRGSQCGSSQKSLRHETQLCVANMPFSHLPNCEGIYTGEINDYGQLHGRGTLSYDDGKAFHGRWTNGSFGVIEANAAPKPGKVRGRR